MLILLNFYQVKEAPLEFLWNLLIQNGSLILSGAPCGISVDMSYDFFSLNTLTETLSLYYDTGAMLARD